MIKLKMSEMVRISNKSPTKVVAKDETELFISTEKELYPMRLTNRISRWDQIGAAQIILKGADVSWIEGANINSLFNSNKFKEKKMSMIEDQKFKEELQIELDLGIVSEVKQSSIVHYNPSYTIRKRGGMWRKILDCRKLNQFTKISHFRMDNVTQVMQLMKKGDFATTLDVQKAYHHIQVSKELQKFLESSNILFNNEESSQVNKDTMESQSDKLYRRFPDTQSRQDSIGTGYEVNHSIHEKSRLEHAASEMSCDPTEDIRISWMEVEFDKPRNVDTCEEEKIT
ncbi:MAG: hypothetical protein EZS28_016598, partial [Streblomastix strix]